MLSETGLGAQNVRTSNRVLTDRWVRSPGACHGRFPPDPDR